MRLKQQIIEVLAMYSKNKYSTKSFCEVLGDLCLFESNGIKCFQGRQKESLKKLLELTERYSPFESDFEKYPGVYCTEYEIKEYLSHIIPLFHNEIKW